MSNVVWSGELYKVFRVPVMANARTNNYIIEEVATGLRLSKFSKLGLAVATARNLEAGMGYAGWTPSFIARTL